MQYDAIKAALAEPFARQIGGCAQFFRALGWPEIQSGSPPSATLFVLVVAVTKVMILSALFSLKEEQDHERKKRPPLA